MGKSIGTSEQKRLLELLRRIRLDAGLRQVDLAEKLGQPQSFVSKYESGERRLDLLELRQICDVVGIPLIKFIQMFESVVSAPKRQRSPQIQKS
jgi:transcriptional regulator with XRE-family HTH domain